MTEQGEPKHPSTRGVIRQILRGVDSLMMVLAPMAILGFVFITIIALDGFGTHTNLVRALESDGVVAAGSLHYDGGEDPTAVVELAGGSQDYLVLYLKYYSRATLAALTDGQMVRVRYTFPPEHEYQVVLEDHFDEVRGYWGYLKDVIWVLAACWFMVVLHPELLYLGFTAAFDEVLKK